MFRIINGLKHYISFQERLWSDYGIHREHYAQRYAQGLAQDVALGRTERAKPAHQSRRATFPSLLGQDARSLGRTNIIDYRPLRGSFGFLDRTQPYIEIFPNGQRFYRPVLGRCAA